MTTDRYLLGADGGGSKTAVVLTDLDLRVKHCKSFPRSNPGDIGYDATERLLLSAFDEVRREAGVPSEAVAAVFAGVAGLSAGDCAPRFRAALRRAYPRAAVDCSHDGINVLYAAFPDGEDGVSVICGTGSSCFVRRGDSLYRIGGCGQFDLKGNGYEIGRAAFAHVFRAMDGRDASGCTNGSAATATRTSSRSTILPRTNSLPTRRWSLKRRGSIATGRRSPSCAKTCTTSPN